MLQERSEDHVKKLSIYCEDPARIAHTSPLWSKPSIIRRHRPAIEYEEVTLLTRLLDARTSQNASYGFSISLPLQPDTPTIIGTIGLDVTGASGILRVMFGATAVIVPPEVLPPGTFLALGVLLGTVFDQGSLVAYEVLPLGPGAQGVRILSLNASHYNVPYPPSNELIYSLVLYSTIGGLRVGPESFYATAYCD